MASHRVAGEAGRDGALHAKEKCDGTLDVILEQWQWRLVVREFRSEEEPIELYQDPDQLIDQLFQLAA